MCAIADDATEYMAGGVLQIQNILPETAGWRAVVCDQSNALQSSVGSCIAPKIKSSAVQADRRPGRDLSAIAQLHRRAIDGDPAQAHCVSGGPACLTQHDSSLIHHQA